MLLNKEQLDSYKNISIAVIGDIMLDKYVYGVVDRISPEAPIPIVTAENEVETLKWYSLAKAQGNEVAADNLKLIQKKMSHAQIAKAQELAAEWWEEHNN